MKTLLGAIGLIALAGCTSSPGACASAQKGVAVAEATVAAYPDPAEIPAVLTDNLATAKAALPLFCPAPTTVVVQP